MNTFVMARTVVDDERAEREMRLEPPVYGLEEAREPPSRLAGVISTRTLTLVNVAVTLACLAIAASTSSREQWHSVGLLLVVAAFTTVAEFGAVWFPRQIAGSLSTVGLAVAMTFAGPAPAVVLGIVPVTVESLQRGVPVPRVFTNAAAYGIFTLSGSLAIGAALGGHPPTAGPEALLFGVILLVLASEVLCFAYIALQQAVYVGQSIRRSIRQMLLPLAAFHLVTGAFTGAAAVVYVTAGLGALTTLLALLLLSGRLLQAIALAQERGQQVAELAVARARLLAEALTAEERERVRLAGEIHDDALQELALAQLDLRAADRDAAALERGRRSLENAIAAIRGTLSRIVPAAEMRSVGLESALEALAGDLCEPAGLAWHVAVDPALSGCDQTLVCSLARELVTNVVKHAEASRVEIRVDPVGAGVRLQVADDGRGFDAAADPGHVGLALVENRARAADGRLEISSSPGHGTVVAVELDVHH